LSDATLPTASTAAAPPRLTEDYAALIIGVAVVALALLGAAGPDLLGWVVSTAVWTDVGTALKPASKAYASLGAFGSLAATYLALLVVLSAGAAAMGLELRRFALRFTLVFAIAYAAWILGSYAHLAAVTPAEYKKFGIGWSLRLTNEGGFIVALVAGLVIANVFPRLADWLGEAIRPELYIKIAIVLLGAFWR